MSCSAGGWVCTQAFAVRVHQEVCLDVTVLELLFKTFIVSQGKGTQNRDHFYSVNPIETMKLLHLYLKLAAPACWQAEEDSHQNQEYGTCPRIFHGEDCSEPHSYLMYPVISPLLGGDGSLPGIRSFVPVATLGLPRGSEHSRHLEHQDKHRGISRSPCCFSAPAWQQFLQCLPVELLFFFPILFSNSLDVGKINQG